MQGDGQDDLQNYLETIDNILIYQVKNYLDEKEGKNNEN